MQGIFVSSTFEDLLDYRLVVEETLRQFDLPTLDVTASHTPIIDLVQTSFFALRRAQLFLGLYATCYGEILEGYEAGLTELVYGEALRLGLPRYVYLVHPRESWPLAYLHTDQRGALMRMFLDRVLQSHSLLRYFSSPTDLREKVRFDLLRLKTERPAQGWALRRAFGPKNAIPSF